MDIEDESPLAPNRDAAKNEHEIETRYYENILSCRQDLGITSLLRRQTGVRAGNHLDLQMTLQKQATIKL